MNEKINLAELLEGCEGETFYSTVHGKVKLSVIVKCSTYTIHTISKHGGESFTSFGELNNGEGECVLFPSKDQRDWKKWKAEREAEMEYQFNPFDKVLVRDYEEDRWECSFYSHKAGCDLDGHICVGSSWNYCIPYEGNEHLAGTTDNV
ncbi:MAG: hypothetical protein ACRCZZ_07190 [Phocaeicola sp.]